MSLDPSDPGNVRIFSKIITSYSISETDRKALCKKPWDALLIFFFFMPLPHFPGSVLLLPSENQADSRSRTLTVLRSNGIPAWRTHTGNAALQLKVVTHHTFIFSAQPVQNLHLKIHIGLRIKWLRMLFQIAFGKNHAGTMQYTSLRRDTAVDTLFCSSSALYSLPDCRAVLSPLLSNSRIGFFVRATFSRFFLTDSSEYP